MARVGMRNEYIHGYGMRKGDEVGWRRRWAQVGNGHGGHRGVMVEVRPDESLH